jgi:hypothetical protein
MPYDADPAGPIGAGAATAAKYWSITDHVCLACLGRVLASAPLGATRIFRCVNCGATTDAVGAAPGSICACAARVGKKDAGLRCVRNDRQRPELMCEIIAKDRG